MTTGGKKRGAVMGKLVTSGQRWSGGSVSSPRSPLEFKIVSPRGVVDAAGGVGLGIVAALIGDHEEEEDDEEYTIVTRHMPNNNSYRKVYECVFFDISPPPVKLGDHHHHNHQFLSSCCDECNKQLDGRDVYMYKGETPFCSVECRSLGMWKEGKRATKSNCCSQSQSQSAPSPSPSPNSHIFSGIFAI